MGCAIWGIDPPSDRKRIVLSAEVTLYADSAHSDADSAHFVESSISMDASSVEGILDSDWENVEVESLNWSATTVEDAD